MLSSLIRIKAIKISTLAVTVVLILFSFGCQNSESTDETNANLSTNVSPTVQEKTSNKKVRSANFVDIPNLANKSAAAFDEVFGKPVKITPIKGNPAMMPGEYREYRVEGHPKNLSVRFYKDEAKRFNLILGTPMKSSKQAISDIFKIDLGNTEPDKTSEPLSEKWKGDFSGVNFVTLYAKRERSGGDFTMVHAEILK